MSLWLWLSNSKLLPLFVDRNRNEDDITAIDSSKRETHLTQTSILLLLLDSAVLDAEFEQSPHTYIHI
jgi:hypothetical protein